MLHAPLDAIHFKINHGPFTHFDFYLREEAERSVPITDEDVERGYLENGWVVWMGPSRFQMAHCTTQTLRSLGQDVEVHRTPDGWIVRGMLGYYAMAIKTRLSLSADEVVGVRMRVEDLQPGMVFTDTSGSNRYYVYLSENRVRILGSESALTIRWPNDYSAVVCCTRPSMQFILK